MCLADVKTTPGPESILHDDRPFVKDLLEKHAEAISSVRDIILNDALGKELYQKGDNPKRYDSIWMLRFVLSHKGNVESASNAALKTIKFRDEKKMNELGDIRHRLKNHGASSSNAVNFVEPLPGHSSYDQFCGAGAAFFCQHDRDRGIVIYVDIGKLDQKGFAENMSKEDMKEYVLHANEAMYQVLDEVTRRTGRLTKQMKILDMKNVSFRKVNLAYIKREGACSKEYQDFYPQLSGPIFIANSPSWLSTLWSTLRPFFPKRLVEKVFFLPNLPKLQSSTNKLNVILRYVSEEHLPERYGGKNEEWPLPCLASQFGPQSSQ